MSEKEVGYRLTEIIMVRIYSFSTAGFGVVFKFIGGYGMKNKKSLVTNVAHRATTVTKHELDKRSELGGNMRFSQR